MRWRPGLRVPLLIFFAMALVSATLEPAAGAPLAFVAPIDDIRLTASSTQVGAIDLSSHFSASGDPVAYTALPYPAGAPSGPDAPFVRIHDHWADIVAPTATWTGPREFQVEACIGTGATASCAWSNVFTVFVDPPPFGRPDLNPPGFEIVGLPNATGSAPGDRLDLQLAVDPSQEVLDTPEWYLDGGPIGTGDRVQLDAPAPGSHRLEVRFESQDGPVVVAREFRVGLGPSGSTGQFGALFALAVFGGLLGTSVLFERSARLRRPLVLFVVASVYARLKRDSLLDHFNRGALHQVIKENPGIHFSEVRRRTGISHGSAIHHLRALEQGGYIRSVATGAHTRYFSTGQPMDDATYGLSPTDTALMAVVVDHPGIPLAELASRMGRSLGTTSRAVSRLASLGYVTTLLSRRRRLVYPRSGGPPAPQAYDAAGAEV